MIATYSLTAEQLKALLATVFEAGWGGGSAFQRDGGLGCDSAPGYSEVCDNTISKVIESLPTEGL